jgi:opacity protein-like surface antigen
MSRSVPASWGAALTLIAAGLLALPSTAQDEDPADDAPAAEETDEYRQRGLYLTAMALGAFPTVQDGFLERWSGGASGVSADPGAGASGRLGYRVAERLAVEVGGDWVNEIQVDGTVNGQSQSARAKLWNVTGNARWFFRDQRFQPYALLGAGYGQVDLSTGGSSPLAGQGGSRDGFVARFGLGADLYAKRDVALTFEAGYVLPTGDIRGTDYFSIALGLTLRFYGAD